LTELQKKYSGRVKVISIDVWEQDAARADQFVAKQGVRMNYAIAQDLVPAGRTFYEGKFAKTWIEGAGKYSVGIPLAYIVDGNGMIAWIGHPTELDRPLEQIVAGAWDLAGAKANYDAEMKESLISEPFKVAFYESERSQNWKGVIGASESLLQLDSDKYAEWAGRGFAVVYSEGKMPGLAMSFAKKAIQESYKSEPRVLAVLALSLARTGSAPHSPEIALAQEAANTAYRFVKGEKAFAMAAVARVLFAKGEKEKAIELQRRALDKAVDPDEKADMQILLDFMLGKK
jgi:tetratricopeptide (TPR) repeat protein